MVKQGRPTQEDVPRSEKIEICLTPEEKDLIRQAADRLDYSGMSEYMREMIFLATRNIVAGRSRKDVEQAFNSTAKMMSSRLGTQPAIILNLSMDEET